jgi:D-xylose transport system substrate-binding protein
VLNDVVTVTRENMLQSVVKDGFHSYEEVYRGVPENERPKPL